jgi:hypothetical protein
LIRRNAMIKRVAESEEWRRYLDEAPRRRTESRVGGGSVPATAWRKDAVVRG